MVRPFALCFVTYYPHRDLLTRIKGALKDGYTVYIWDNTPSGDKLFHNIKEDNLFIHGNGINKGVGFALNKLLTHVHNELFSLALYFDQDTLFSTAGLSWIMNWLNHNELNIKETAVLNFKSNTPENEIKKSKLQNAYFVISSGSLFKLENIRKIGWHNPKFFLECVDYELCARAHFLNFTISQVSGCPGLNHYELQPFNSAIIFNRKFEFRLYSINRNFSFIFNLLRLSLKSLFKGHFMLAWYFFRNIITHLLNQIRAIFLTSLNIFTIVK
jgi:rhamnosyltransferase